MELQRNRRFPGVPTAGNTAKPVLVTVPKPVLVTVPETALATVPRTGAGNSAEPRIAAETLDPVMIH